MKYLYFLITMLMLAPVSLGQQNITAQIPEAINLMKQKRWEEAQTKWESILDELANRRVRLISETYGIIYYNKGYSELQLGKEIQDLTKKQEYFKMASDSMKECFEIHMRANKVHAKSLLYRARAEQGLGNMATAIELNKLFLSIQKPVQKPE